MPKRHSDALFIQEGACNPSAIALSIVEACRAMRADPDHKGTDEITSDPAVRLMVHQLGFICGIWYLDHSDEADPRSWAAATESCRSTLAKE